MNRKLFIEMYGGKKAVHCDSKEKANEFLKLADSLGFKWFSGVSLLDKSNWHKKDTCYCLKSYYFLWEHLDYYKSLDYEIVEYQLQSKQIIVDYTDIEVRVKKDNKTATAKLHPEDKFDLLTGIKVALDKLKKKEITEDEKVILRNIDKKYKWIARDKYNNRLYLYVEKPLKKDSNNWFLWGEFFDFTPFNHLFQNIQWEDTEPIHIPDLLGE